MAEQIPIQLPPPIGINDLYGHPNLGVPGSKYPSASYGATAALRLFDKYQTNSHLKAHFWYFTGNNTLNNNNAITWANAQPNDYAPNGWGNRQIASLLVQIGKGHFRILKTGRTVGIYMNQRFNDARYDLNNFDNYAADADEDLEAYTKAMTSINTYFVNLGNAFGINPSLVKSAFVTTLKNRYESLSPSYTWENGRGIQADTLYTNMERLWGTPSLTIPNTYYKDFGAYAMEGGGGRRRMGRKRKRNRRRYY